jgi:hypothetical protein
MFEKDEKLTAEQIKEIADSVQIPRFTDLRVEVQIKGNILTFLIDNHVQGIQRDWTMIESGMQHQATGLICAALGVGMVFKSLGDDGTAISASDYGTTRIKLDAMKPSYDGSCWSTLPPDRTKPWKTGNLPDPVRQGNVPLLTAMRKVRAENITGRKATEASLSQLLWAGRGRTPHLYKSRPWGLTIAVSKGEQKISSVYVVADERLSTYVNWEKNRPTHSLSRSKSVDSEHIRRIKELFPPGNRFIVLGRNEHFQRANWEVGYQLLNLILQAHSLGIDYKAFLLNEGTRDILTKIGIQNPAAVFSV